MNTERLHEIIRETTVQLRKGAPVTERVHGSIRVTDLYDMPHVDEITGVEKIDLEFIVVGVNKDAARRRKDELVAILKGYPEPERLASGPSYMEVGGMIGDQGAALQLFALGKVLGLWDVITPKALNLTGAAAREAAGRGMVMMTGFDGRAP